MTSYNKKKLSGILFLIIVYFAAILIVGNYFAFSYATVISQFLHQDMYRIEEVEGGEEVDTNYFKSDYAQLNDLIEAETEYAHEVQAEGVVLLKNSGLPLAGSETVALLGMDSKDDVYRPGGSGSGAVNTERAPAIADTFREAGFTVDPDVLAYYSGLSATTPEPDASALPAFDADVGIVFIGRSGGESDDLVLSDLSLSEAERSLVEASMANCSETVVLLNTSNALELGWLAEQDVSIVWVGASGEVATGVIPQILAGDIVPSGKLVDTYVYDSMSSPAMRNYGDFNLTNVSETTGNKYVSYAESIYYGYRYYETRYADAVMGAANVGDYEYSEQVLYPYGYGLSYTSFEYSDFAMSEAGGSFTLSVTVTNTGDLAGKEAVGFYMQSPYTDYDREYGIEKSAIQLVDFAKTRLLQPGASETLIVTVSREMLKTYDANGAGTYIVDAGDYTFTAGENVHAALNNVLAAQGYGVSDGMTAEGNADLTAVYTRQDRDTTTYAVSSVTGAAVGNLFADADLRYYMPDTVYLTRSDWEGTYPEQAADMEATSEMIADLSYDAVTVDELTEDPDAAMPTMGAQNGLTLASMIGWDANGELMKVDYDSDSWSQLLDQMTAEELMRLWSVGGYTTVAVESISKPASIDQDGPATLGGALMGGTNTFAYPTEMLLASTWNKDLVAEMGYYIGEDGLMTGVTGWYAPGINIHRTPLGGRNYEYYSEDPVQSGMFAALVIEQAQAKGIVVYAKHYALNEQEVNRSSACTFATEQAIREIYLKPFEIAVVDGGAKGLMNSMNRIGMVWAGAHEALLTDILRGEWGFRGIVITDATLAQSNKMRPLPTLLAGTDLMLCTNAGIFEIENYASSATVMSALRESAHRILYAFADSSVMNGLSASTRVIQIMPAWQITLIVVDCVLAAAAVTGIVCIVRWLVRDAKQNQKEAVK